MPLKALIFFLLLSAGFLSSCSKGTNSDAAAVSERSANSDSDGDLFATPGDGTMGASGVDPLAVHSWHLNNTGQKTFSSCAGCTGRAIPGNDANLGISHELYNQGKGIKIAISDNGTDIMHEDLYFNIDRTLMRNYTQSDPNSWLGNPLPNAKGEVAAHGTAVTGIIGALKDNSRGAYGVAPESTLIPFKYVGTTGSWAKEIDQANGLMDIFNYSYGRNSCTYRYMNPDYLDQLRYGVTELRQGKGALYVKAAGNEYYGYLGDCDDDNDDNDNLEYFGNASLEEDNSYPYLTVVAALNASGQSSSYSSPGSAVWISAPAGEFGISTPAIISTDLMGCKNGFSHESSSYNDFEKGKLILNANCDYTSTMNGTSAAAPMVSGAMALILAQNPDLSWRDVKDILARSARQVDLGNVGATHPLEGTYPSPSGHTYMQGWVENAAGFKFHNWYGFGALDISKALQLAQSRHYTMPQLYETVQAGGWKYTQSLNLSVPDNEAFGVSTKIAVNDNLIVEALQVRLSVTHGRSSDLGVEITSPAGTKSQLMLVNSNILDRNLADVILLSNAFYGEEALGEWTLKVLDGKSGTSGTLKHWGLNIFGHAKNADMLDLASVRSQDEGLRRDLAQIKSVSVLNTNEGISTVPQLQGASTHKPSKASAPKKAARAPAIVQHGTHSSVSYAHRMGASQHSDDTQDSQEVNQAVLTNACLVARDRELKLVSSDYETTLQADRSEVILLALNAQKEKIVVLVREKDGETGKVLVYDSKLKIIDEGLIENAKWSAELSAAIFHEDSLFLLDQTGLGTLNLKDFKFASLVEIPELSKLRPTKDGLIAESKAERFYFDANGLVLKRERLVPSLDESYPRWERAFGLDQFCVDAKELNGEVK